MLTVAVTAVASVLTAVVAAAITYVLTKRREHEADWRRLKLEQYREFVLALSGIVGRRSTPDAQGRYADAVNTMTLVAPPAVLRALQSFQAQISHRNRNQSLVEHDRALSTLLRAMRADVHPVNPEDPQDFAFVLWDSEPAMAEGTERPEGN